MPTCPRRRCGRTPPSRRFSARRWVSRCDERRRLPVPLRGDCERRVQCPDVCRHFEPRCPRRSNSFTPLNYRNPAQLPEGGVLVVGPSATGVQLAARFIARAAMSRFRLASTFACRGPTADATCSGGWSRLASGISDTTRSTTSRARAGCRRRSSLARRSGARWISTR